MNFCFGYLLMLPSLPTCSDVEVMEAIETAGALGMVKQATAKLHPAADFAASRGSCDALVSVNTQGGWGTWRRQSCA